MDRYCVGNFSVFKNYPPGELRRLAVMGPSQKGSKSLKNKGYHPRGDDHIQPLSDFFFLLVAMIGKSQQEKHYPRPEHISPVPQIQRLDGILFVAGIENKNIAQPRPNNAP